MSDDKLNKQWFDRISSIIDEGLKKGTEDPRLTDISPIADFNINIQYLLKKLYGHHSPRVKRFGSVVNSFFTHGTDTFIITQELVAQLVAKDNHYPQKSCDPVMFGKVKGYFLENGFLAEIRAPIRNNKGIRGKCGLYRIIHPDFLQPLIDRVGAAAIAANRQSVIEWFDKHNPPEQPKEEVSPEIQEERKEIERIVHERNKHLNS
jgi:hypothetical protein